jgi:hypothetical protein
MVWNLKVTSVFYNGKITYFLYIGYVSHIFFWVITFSLINYNALLFCSYELTTLSPELIKLSFCVQNSYSISQMR